MIIPTGYAQVTHEFGGNGLAFPGAVVYGVDPPGGADPSDLAEALSDAWATYVIPRQNESITLENTVVKFGPNSTGPTGEFAVTIPGERTGAGSPSNCAVLVKKTTSLGGKQGRGRMYIPGCTEADVGSDGALDATQQGNWQTAMSNWAAFLAISVAPLVILHGDALTPTPVTAVTVQAVIATQRRRLRR